MARRQIEALREQRRHTLELRAWRESIIRKVEKARAKRAKKRAKRKPDGTRGIDRVPAHLRGLAVVPQALDGHRPGHTYINPERDSKPGARLRRDEPVAVERKRPVLRRVEPRKFERPGRQVLAPHPMRVQLLRARAQTPSQWLKAQRMLLKGYGAAFTTKRGDLAYDCGECGFHIRNGYDPDESGFWTDVQDHEQEHRDSESVAL